MTILYETELPTPATELWVDKYRPKTLSAVIGHAQTIKDLRVWLNQFPNKGTAALLTGPPGIGKTTVAHLLAAEAGYAIVELNASDERSAAAVRTLFDRLRQTGGFLTEKRIIIMDEVDGMSAGDRGGIGELARIIRAGCVSPILCLANERSAPKLRPLASACVDIRFTRPTKTTIAKAIHERIGEASCGVKAIEELCERNGNDIRSILNALQFDCAVLGAAGSGAAGSGAAGHVASKDESLRLDPFSATGRLFGRGASLQEREQAFFVDHSMVPLMVAEGYVAAAGKSASTSDAMDALSAASDAVGDWDLLDARIHRRQDWSLLPSAATSIVRAAYMANGPAPFQIFPSWLGKQSKRVKHRRMMSEMRMAGCGHGEAELDTRSTLRTLLFAKPVSPTSVVDALIALGLTRDDMLETLVETVFRGDEEAVALDTKTKSAITREWRKRCTLTEANTKHKDPNNDDEDEDDIIDPDDDDIDELE